MQNRGEFIRNYWKNYLFLENRFLATDNFVSIQKENNDTFSYEYLSLFILLCNEFDAVSTEFCNYIEGKERRRDINEKIRIIREKCPYLGNYKVIVSPNFEGYSFVPFAKFDDTASDWWRDYTFVKHYRSQKDKKTDKPNYYKANLKNVFSALAALYLLSMLFYEKLENNNKNYRLDSRVFEGYDL